MATMSVTTGTADDIAADPNVAAPSAAATTVPFAVVCHDFSDFVAASILLLDHGRPIVVFDEDHEVFGDDRSRATQRAGRPVHAVIYTCDFGTADAIGLPDTDLAVALNSAELELEAVRGQFRLDALTAMFA